MKNSIKYVAVALTLGSMASCADLDTEYMGGYVSTDQKEDALSKKPELASASVSALYSQTLRLGPYLDAANVHFDFGYPAIMLGMDMMTADMNGTDSGYNWFRNWQSFGSNGPTSYVTVMYWDPVYENIKICNDNLAAIPADTEEPTLMFFRAQSLGQRATDYWMLAQIYQFNYQVNPSAKCVPVVTDENASEAASTGVPRATLEQMYGQILADATSAIELLGATPIKAENVISDKPKRMISLATAYGIRARAYMSMGKYAEAAADAQAAITSFNGRPATIDEVNHPTFTSLNETNWMWGFAVAETDDLVQTGIVNWPSMACTFCDGYTNVGGWRWISKDLWESIPATDVRKGWFIDENYQSPNLSAAQQAYVDSYVTDVPSYANFSGNGPIYPYTNVKFDSYQGVLMQTTNAQDYPKMRIEEMYYILAEAQGMSAGVAQGKATLESFVKTYRDPAFASKATSAAELQDEIFQQKRVELWGEGLMYYEYQRLCKTVDRTRAHAPYSFTFVIPANAANRIYCLPDTEISANKAIDKDDNNEIADRPVPVPWAE
ncbi:MAG: RagB/SusD family nutrient uptake outer membrane protein [Bacteroidales bacterium]|nr:RagB/SusD family nutrient uptake outer membrane protein [Bacteroidales bacterium]